MAATALLTLSTLLIPTVLPLDEMSQWPEAHVQQIVLVRHGESRFNLPDENGLYYTSGKSKPSPLTPKGLEQARMTGSKLIDKLPKDREIVICSSTARRAHDTAMAIFQTLQPHHSCHLGQSFDELLELGQGRWEGLPRDAIYEREIKKWEQLPATLKLVTPKLETGESFQDCIDRGLPALQTLVDLYPGKRIFVVTHFMMMNALCMHWCDLVSQLSDAPGSKLPMVVLGNCDMLVIEIPYGQAIQGQAIQEAKVAVHIKSGL